jgi:hypothetical protein
VRGSQRRPPSTRSHAPPRRLPPHRQLDDARRAAPKIATSHAAEYHRARSSPCRAGFAGRGTPLAREPRAPTSASVPEPSRGSARSHAFHVICWVAYRADTD